MQQQQNEKSPVTQVNITFISAQILLPGLYFTEPTRARSS